MTTLEPAPDARRLGDASSFDLRAALATRTVDLWLQRIDLSAPESVGLVEVLSSDERERADRYRFPADRQRYVVARAALRWLLWRYTGVEPASLAFEYRCVCRNPQCARTRRKPELAGAAADTDVRFNVSHSGDFALYAVAHGREVGVDIEQVRADIDWRALAREAFSEADAQWVCRLDHPGGRDAFYRGWTRKEALLKAMGRGLAAMPVPHPDLLAPEGTGDATGWVYEDHKFEFAELSGVPAGYAAAIAMDGGLPAFPLAVHPFDVRTLRQVYAATRPPAGEPS